MAADVASNARMTAELPSVDALWLDALQRACTRAAHELKGALNGVSVNLEVVRSRSERPDSPASAVAKYAASATDQLGAVIVMTDALLSLARPAREPVNVGAVLRRLEVLLASSARADGRALELRGPIDDIGTTSAIGNAARMVLLASLLAALEASTDVVCGVETIADGCAVVVQIECRDGAAVRLDADVVAVAAEQGIDLRAESSMISISLPR
jgi:signal transduction histidine kinase